jgi:hypothetical protein
VSRLVERFLSSPVPIVYFLGDTKDLRVLDLPYDAVYIFLRANMVCRGHRDACVNRQGVEIFTYPLVYQPLGRAKTSDKFDWACVLAGIMYDHNSPISRP